MKNIQSGILESIARHAKYLLIEQRPGCNARECLNQLAEIVDGVDIVVGLARGRKVISISGDGGFGKYMGDFTTAVKYGMNITRVLLNNGELGKISKERRAGHFRAVTR
jgi:hypothetical protein